MSKARKRVRLMPAIREESNLRTNRIPVHIIPPGAKSQGNPLQSSMIIQTLPEEPSRPHPKVTSSNRYHDNVEQVVSDYLHFARYGKLLPVSQGFAPLPCPCCSDRNRENMQHMKDRFRAPSPEPDPDVLPEPLSRATPLTGATNAEPDNGVGRRTARFSGVDEIREVSPRRETAFGGGGGNPMRAGFPASWMDYQPSPYAQTYLNSEFNRAAMLKDYEEDRRQYHDSSMAYVSSRVLDANTKYDLAMKKLERSLNNFSVSGEEESELSYQ